MDPITFTFPGFRQIISTLKKLMDPITITFPGFRNLWQDKFSGGASLSNDYVIVFPIGSFDKKFNRSIYSPEMTDGRASSEEINQALSLFEIALSRSISTWEIVKSFCWRFLLPFIMLALFSGNYMLRSPGPIWSSFLVYCVIGILYLFANKNTQTKRAKADSQSALDFVQPSYLEKGLRWRIPEESCGWIELIKEYREGEVISPLVIKVNSQYEPPQNIV